VEHLDPPPDVVTEMWAERCLQSKRFFEPDEHVLSRPIRLFPIPGFEKLVINSTGVGNIDLLHLSQAVRLLGAKYDQVLKTGISVLLCNSSKAGKEKLRHAHEWRIPAVSIEWLWACIRSGQMQSFRAFLLEQGQSSATIIADPNAVVSARPSEAAQIERREQLATNGLHAESAQSARKSVLRDSVANDADSHQTSRAPRAMVIPGEGFPKTPRHREGGSELRSKKKTASIDLAAAANKQEPQEDRNFDAEVAGTGLPLQEISTNSPPKSELAPSPRAQRLFRHFGRQSSLASGNQDDESPSAPEATSTGKTTYLPPRAESINGAIKELLGKSKAKNPITANSHGETRKRRLLGRALSNMSNSSREGSNMRASRASSIDSVNTDGLGSVILDETCQSKRPGSAGAGGRSSFTGRASAPERGVKESSIELGEAALYREEYQEEAELPQMTQLGYENPDDAVALREMLAERRRNRTRKGQEDIKPPNPKEGKKIKDDATVVPTGRGTGRRARQKAKSP